MRVATRVAQYSSDPWPDFPAAADLATSPSPKDDFTCGHIESQNIRRIFLNLNAMPTAAATRWKCGWLFPSVRNRKSRWRMVIDTALHFPELENRDLMKWNQKETLSDWSDELSSSSSLSSFTDTWPISTRLIWEQTARKEAKIVFLFLFSNREPLHVNWERKSVIVSSY